MDVWVSEYVGDYRVLDYLWDFVYEWAEGVECVEMVCLSPPLSIQAALYGADRDRVYLLEGLFTILFSGVIFFVLPDWPKSSQSRKWLSEREQEYLEARLSENAPRAKDANFDMGEMVDALKDQKTYSFMISQVLINFAGYALSWQLPTITTSLGFAGLPRNQLLNIPPAAASVLSIIFSGWFLKRAYMTRPAYIMACIMGPMLLFFILLAVLDNKIGIYVACVLGTMFYSVYFIPFWACTFRAPLYMLGSPTNNCTRAKFLLKRHHRVRIHPGLPVLRRPSRRRHRAATVPVAVCLQRVQDAVCDLRGGDRGFVGDEWLDVVVDAQCRV